MPEMKFPVTFNDIDFNGHVGNTRSIVDESIVLGAKVDFNWISIKFEDEVRYGDQVTSEVNIIDDGNTTVHQIMVDGKARSMAEIT